ncbi:hypothetical protein H6G65_17335 [Microcystis elabens FACHB-917]|nr:hypothetical protein [Microcystis elabens FACHB-917]
MTSSVIVPISLPLTTGAGTMSTITVYAEAARSLDLRLQLFAAIWAMAILIGLMFTFATRLTRVLGHGGMTVLIIATGASTILSQVTLKL